MTGYTRGMLTGLFFLVLLVAAGGERADAYTFRPQWVPQAQFAGYYMAVKQGFYKAAGIDVTIKDGGPGIVALQEVANGETDFASGLLLSALRIKANVGDVALVAQIIQRPAQMLLAKKETGINSVSDFAGHSLGVWPGDFQIPPKALIRKQRLRNVEIVEQGFTMDGFLKGEIDIASAMRYNEYHQVLNSGLSKDDLAVFDYSDYDMGLPEDGVYVLKSFLEANPEACEKFAAATGKGWAYAFANKDETVAHMTELANKTDFKTSKEKQMTMLNEIEKLVDVDNPGLSRDAFDRAVQALKRTRMLRGDIAYEEFTAPFARR